MVAAILAFVGHFVGVAVQTGAARRACEIVGDAGVVRAADAWLIRFAGPAGLARRGRAPLNRLADRKPDYPVGMPKIAPDYPVLNQKRNSLRDIKTKNPRLGQPRLAGFWFNFLKLFF